MNKVKNVKTKELKFAINININAYRVGYELSVVQLEADFISISYPHNIPAKCNTLSLLEAFYPVFHTR